MSVMKRGDRVTAPGGVEGQYVGVLNGIIWIAWAGEDFETVCAAFDAAVKKER